MKSFSFHPNYVVFFLNICVDCNVNRLQAYATQQNTSTYFKIKVTLSLLVLNAFKRQCRVAPHPV